MINHQIRRRESKKLRIELLENRVVLTGFTAYNGLFPSDETHENTTFFSSIDGEDSAGPLKDIATGDDLSAILTTQQLGVVFDNNGSQPAPGTDAANIFNGFVDFSAGDRKSIEIDPNAAYRYSFENLDSGATYQFAGTAIRGNSSYTDRWTLVEILSAESFNVAHSVGEGVITEGLPENQVAFWAGHNAAAEQGFVAQWVDIDPGADGKFHIAVSQYTGDIPTSIDAGGIADGSKSYGISGVRLIEDAPEGPPVVQNSVARNVLAFEAEIGGEVTSTGGQVPRVLIYYGTEDGGADQLGWQRVVDLGNQSRGFSAILDDLQQNTTYFYRAFAENSLGKSWAPTASSFTTQNATAPTIENVEPSSIGAFSAVLNGNVTDTGNEVPLVTVYYGETDGGTDVDTWSNSVVVGEEPGEFGAAVVDLQPLTEYFYTTFAQNRQGFDWATPSQSFTTTDTPPLQINEFMADNESVLSTRVRVNHGDPFVGDEITPDWIELFNPTAGVAEIGGFYLTDDLSNRTKWQFPAGSVIPPQGYLVVYASGLNITDNRLDESGRLHTNFELSGDGSDKLGLADADGKLVFSIDDIPLQSEDISYGIDLVGEPRFYGTPSPGSSNANNLPEAPVFSLDSTTFTDSVVVELTASLPTHEIRYTTNERVPTIASTLYTGPITVSDTTQIRAIAVSPDGEISTVVSESYIELASSVLDDDSNLPILIVDTFGDGVPGTGSTFGDAFMAIIEPGEDGRTRLTDSFDLTTRGGLHVRGSSSAGFAKKQYRVEFWDEQNEDQKQSVLGMPKEADWIFYGPNQFDRVLINNPLMFDLSNQIGRYATRTRWVEMYLNRSGTVSSSDYVGLYAITEVIEEGDDRVPVGELSSGAGGQPVEGGFIWKNDRGSAYVDPDPANSQQRSYINRWINGLTTAARGANAADPELGYANWADVPSFIDHNILNLFAMNVDALRLSSFYYKRPEGKLEAGPIWDFDRSLESTDGRDNNPRSWFGTGDSTRYFDDSSRVKTWWSDMFDQVDFVQQYIDRWFELRQNELSLDNVYATIDKHIDEISEAAARDYRKWGVGSTIDREVSRVKTWIRRRVEWIDSQWLAVPDFDADSPHVAPGTDVNLRATEGDVYYTLDGSDPRGVGGTIRPDAIKATGPIAINGLTTITARVYSQNHGGSHGYARAGDDWSAPVKRTYFNDSPAAPGSLVISEVNYNPVGPTPGEESQGFDNNDDFEFLELLNASNENIVLTGAALTQVDVDGDTEGVDFRFSEGSIQTLGPGERLLVVENVAAFEARYGDGLPVAGQWSGALSNNNELLTVAAFDGQIVQQFRYRDGGDWPELADGFGGTLELVGDPSDASEPSNWASSVPLGGTPGAPRIEPSGIVINEVLAHTDLPLTDSIELYNPTDQKIDIGGWYLSDSAGDLLKFKIPNGTMLGPHDYATFTENDFNPNPESPGVNDFALSSSRGDEVWLVTGDAQGTSVLTFVDNVDFPATPNGESMGRFPNGTGELYPMQSNTFGSENSSPRVGPLVFTEINYNPGPPSINAIVLFPELTRDDLEFVEIHNPTPEDVHLTNWRIRGGIDYNFDDGLVLPANRSLVVIPFEPNKVENRDRFIAFREQYGLAADAPVVGGYSGKLSDSGETIRLLRPDSPPAEDSTLVPRLWEDVVNYSTDSTWPDANGNRNSLHRAAVTDFGGAPASWTAGNVSPGVFDSVDADFDADGEVTVADTDLVCTGIRSGDVRFDFNQDGILDDEDVDFVVGSIFFSAFGDSNLDRRFNSSDLIQVFQANEYEDDVLLNSLWSEGDWNCDGDFGSGDLVRAFQAGDYVAAAVSAPQDNVISSDLRAAATTDNAKPLATKRPFKQVELQQSGNRPAVQLSTVQVDAVFDAVFDTVFVVKDDHEKIEENRAISQQLGND